MEVHRGRVAVVCGQPMARAGLEQVVSSCPGLELGASTGTVEELAQAEPHDDYLVTVIDLPPLPYRQALEIIAKLSTVGPPLVSSSWDQPPTLLAAVRAGARGLVTRYSGPESIKRTLLTVADGGMSVAPELIERFVAEISRPAEVDDKGLAPREMETLRFIAHGFTHGQIATRMGLSQATVNTYAKRIRAKLNVNNKAELTRIAIELGQLAEGQPPYFR